MKVSFKPVLVALLFAILLIASSYLLKERSLGDWVDATIYMAAVYFLFTYFAGSPNACPVKPNKS
jgi:hypothetical protein